MLLAAILPPAAFAPTGLPTAFDLRSVNGSNILGPVRNHHLPIGSSCASCWSVNTATVLAGRINLARACRPPQRCSGAPFWEEGKV